MLYKSSSIGRGYTSPYFHQSFFKVFWPLLHVLDILDFMLLQLKSAFDPLCSLCLTHVIDV